MKVIILAGGSGTRLWPFSREAYPKQFLKLGSHLSFLQKTVQRFLRAFDVKDIVIITGQELRHLVKSQILEIAPFQDEQIIAEPVRKNTGPTIVLGVKTFPQEECFLVVPSDHEMFPEELFLEKLPLAESLAMEGKIVTFGMKPYKPETGYGYIKTVDGKVDAFIEKPSMEEAKGFLHSGEYLWNSGIFAFQGKVLWEEIQKYCPELLSDDPPSISIDYAVMEKSKKLAVIPLDMAWSDIGSWDSVFDLLKKDHNQNVKIGNIHEVDTRNCLLIGGKRLISTIGIEDIVVIETEDAIFLGKKGESQRVKALVEELKMRGNKEAKEHPTVHRPWGLYTVLEEGPRYKVKRILVNSMQKLSLQMHEHRSEHWVVIKGAAKATIGEKEQLLYENESVYVPIKTVHRLENPGQTPLELIEVQVGSYLGEDDIVRFEDVYGR